MPAEQEFTIGESFSGSVKEITTAGALRAFGDAAAIIELEGGTDGWYPLPEGHNLTEGMVATITPVTHRHESGGSMTTYNVARAEEFKPPK